MNRCPEAPNGQNHMSGIRDPAIAGMLGHGRAVCAFCQKMIRVDLTEGARWVLDDSVIQELPV